MLVKGALWGLLWDFSFQADMNQSIKEDNHTIKLILYSSSQIMKNCAQNYEPLWYW